MNNFLLKNMRGGKAISTLVLTAVWMTVSLSGLNLSAAAQEPTRMRGKAVVVDPLTVSAAAGVDVPDGELQLVSTRPLGASDLFDRSGVLAPSVVGAGAIYSNITTFTGQGVKNGGAAADPANASNTITKLVADDLTLSRTATVAGFTFSVVNFNGVAVSARPLVRFYRADGAGSGPGTLIAAFNFNAISFPAGMVSTFNYTPATPLFPGFGTIWAGETFDNNSGALSITATQMNNLGQGLYNPPNVGTSTDTFFQTTANGSFAASNPTGSFFNVGGNPPANFGWELRTNAPTAATVNVGGRITNQSGRGVARATVTLTGSAGETRSAQTNTLGYYRFADVAAGDTYVVRASAKRLEFAPQVLNITEDLTELNFAGF